MDYNEFAERVKEKYPQYNNIDNYELAQKVVAKYPVYKDKVSFETPKPVANAVAKPITPAKPVVPVKPPVQQPIQPPVQPPVAQPSNVAIKGINSFGGKVGQGFTNLWNDLKGGTVNTFKNAPEIGKGLVQSFWDSGKYALTNNPLKTAKETFRGVGEGIVGLPEGVYNSLVVAPTNSFAGEQVLKPMDYMETVNANADAVYGERDPEAESLRMLTGFIAPGGVVGKVGNTISKSTKAQQLVNKANQVNKMIEKFKAVGNTTRAIQLEDKYKKLINAGKAVDAGKQVAHDAVTGYVFGNEGDLQSGIENAATGIGIGAGFKALGYARNKAVNSKTGKAVSKNFEEVVEANPQLAKAFAEVKTALGEDSKIEAVKKYQEFQKLLNKPASETANKIMEGFNKQDKYSKSDVFDYLEKGVKQAEYDKSFSRLAEAESPTKFHEPKDAIVDNIKAMVELMAPEKKAEKYKPIKPVEIEPEVKAPKEDLTHVNEAPSDVKIDEPTSVEPKQKPISTTKGKSIEGEFERYRKLQSEVNALQRKVDNGSNSLKTRKALKNKSKELEALEKELLDDENVREALDIDAEERSYFEDYTEEQLRAQKEEAYDKYNDDLREKDIEEDPVETSKQPEHDTTDPSMLEFIKDYRSKDKKGRTKTIIQKLKSYKNTAEANINKGDTNISNDFVKEFSNELTRLYETSEANLRRAETLEDEVARGVKMPEEVSAEVKSLRENTYDKKEYDADMDLISRAYNKYKPKRQYATENNKKQASIVASNVTSVNGYGKTIAQKGLDAMKKLGDKVENSLHKKLGSDKKYKEYYDSLDSDARQKIYAEHMQSEYDLMIRKIEAMESSDGFKITEKAKGHAINEINKGVQEWCKLEGNPYIEIKKFKGYKGKQREQVKKLEEANKKYDETYELYNKSEERLGSLIDEREKIKQGLDTAKRKYKNLENKQTQEGRDTSVEIANLSQRLSDVEGLIYDAENNSRNLFKTMSKANLEGVEAIKKGNLKKLAKKDNVVNGIVDKHYSQTTNSATGSILHYDRRIAKLKDSLAKTSDQKTKDSLNRQIKNLEEIKDNIIDNMKSTYYRQNYDYGKKTRTEFDVESTHINQADGKVHSKISKIKDKGDTWEKDSNDASQVELNKAMQFLDRHRSNSKARKEYVDSFLKTGDESGFVDVNKINEEGKKLADLKNAIDKYKGIKENTKGRLGIDDVEYDTRFGKRQGLNYIKAQLNKLELLKEEYGHIPGVKLPRIPDISKLEAKVAKFDAETAKAKADSDSIKAEREKAELKAYEYDAIDNKSTKKDDTKKLGPKRKPKKEQKSSRQVADERSLRVKSKQIQENAKKALKTEANVVPNESNPYEMYKNLRKNWKGTEQAFLDFYGSEKKFVNDVINRRMKKNKVKGEQTKPTEEIKAEEPTNQIEEKLDMVEEQPKVEEPEVKVEETKLEPLPKKDYAPANTKEGIQQRLDDLNDIIKNRINEFDPKDRQTLFKNRDTLEAALKSIEEGKKIKAVKVEENVKSEATSEPVEEPKVKEDTNTKVDDIEEVNFMPDEEPVSKNETIKQEQAVQEKMALDLEDSSPENIKKIEEHCRKFDIPEEDIKTLTDDIKKAGEEKAKQEALNKDLENAKDVYEATKVFVDSAEADAIEWGMISDKQAVGRKGKSVGDKEATYHKRVKQKDKRGFWKRTKDYFDEALGKKSIVEKTVDDTKVGHYGRKERFGAKQKFDYDESMKATLQDAIDKKHTASVMRYVKNTFALPYNGRNLQKGYVPVNLKVLANAFFGKFSKEWVEVWQSRNVTRQQKASNGATDYGQWAELLGDGTPDFQIPQSVFDYLINGSGEKASTWFNRYVKGTKDIGMYARFGGKILGSVNDALLSQWKKGVLTSSTFFINNRRGNQQALYSSADNPIEYIKATFDALQSHINDRKSGKASIPSRLLENNLAKAFDMADTRRCDTGIGWIDNTINLLNGHNLDAKSMKTEYKVREGRNIKIKHKETIKSRLATSANLTIGLPNRIFTHISRKMMDFNTAFEQFERRQAYHIQANKAKSDIVARTGRKILVQKEFLKYIDETPELKEQLIRSVEDTLGDYNNMSRIEQKFIKKHVPFYSWFRAVARYNYKMAKKDPTRLAMMYMQMLQAKENDKDLKEYQRGTLRTGIKDPRSGKELVTRVLTKQDFLETPLEVGEFAKDWSRMFMGDANLTGSRFSLLHPATSGTYEALSGKHSFLNGEITSKDYIKDEKGNYIDKEGNFVSEKRAPLKTRAKRVGKKVVADVVYPFMNSGLAKGVAKTITNKDKEYDADFGFYREGEKFGKTNKTRNAYHNLSRASKALNTFAGTQLQNEHKLNVKEKAKQNKEKKKRLNDKKKNK